MSMNIGSIIKAMLGDSQPGDSRALELRVGQIVRGVLLELMDNQEAMININGVHVKAKLEADMPVGKGMLLQVQPGGIGGVVVLKALAESSDALPEEGLKDILKTFGMPEQKWAMELLRGLKRDGYVIGKETASFFNSAASLKPAGVDAAAWSNAADVAFRRGLPPTETTLTSLRQALFGQPIQDELANLRTAVDSWLSGAKAPTGEAAVLGQRLQSLLSQGAALVAQGATELAGEQQTNNNASAFKGMTTEAMAKPQAESLIRDAAATDLSKSAADSATARADGGAGRVALNGAPLTTPQAQSGFAGQASQAGPSGQGQSVASQSGPTGQVQSGASQSGQGLANAGANTRDLLPEASRAAAQSSSPQNARASAALGAAGAEANRAAAAGIPADAAQPSASKPEAAAWIGRFLQWLGVGHERQLLHSAEARLPGGDAGPSAGGAATLASGADAPGKRRGPRPRIRSRARCSPLRRMMTCPPLCGKRRQRWPIK